ncbi:hypothetical protein CPB85DRAFT_1322349, partial [Mucidula mucida]
QRLDATCAQLPWQRPLNVNRRSKSIVHFDAIMFSLTFIFIGDQQSHQGARALGESDLRVSSRMSISIGFRSCRIVTLPFKMVSTRYVVLYFFTKLKHPNHLEPTKSLCRALYIKNWSWDDVRQHQTMVASHVIILRLQCQTTIRPIISSAKFTTRSKALAPGSSQPPTSRSSRAPSTRNFLSVERREHPLSGAHTV